MDIEFFDGIDIKTLFEKALHSKEKQLRTVLTGKPLVYLAGEEYAKEFINKRIEEGIYVKSLRLTGEPEKTATKEIRISKDLKIQYSLVIWDDYVAIVDDSCLLIKNTKNSDTMKSWFDCVWNSSN